MNDNEYNSMIVSSLVEFLNMQPKVMLSTNRVYLNLEQALAKSLINIKNNKEPKTDHYGTP